jgi:hypothetical protein
LPRGEPIALQIGRRFFFAVNYCGAREKVNAKQPAPALR